MHDGIGFLWIAFYFPLKKPDLIHFLHLERKNELHQENASRNFNKGPEDRNFNKGRGLPTKQADQTYTCNLKLNHS